MKMFEDGQDPWSKIQELEALVMHHHRELRQLTNNMNELIKAYNAQAQLVRQITEQNTQLLKDLAVLHTFSKS